MTTEVRLASEVEAALQQLTEAEAAAMALVLSHEGHIAKLDAALAEKDRFIAVLTKERDDLGDECLRCYEFFDALRAHLDWCVSSSSTGGRKSRE